MLQSWDELRRAARTAERQLEEKIAAYKDISREAGAKRGEQFDEGLRLPGLSPTAAWTNRMRCCSVGL